MKNQIIRQIEALQGAHEALPDKYNIITTLEEANEVIKTVDEIKQTLNKILTLPELQQFKYLPLKTDIENLMRRI